MSIIIGVTSGKGGTGKTTICAGLSYAFASIDKKILIIELDIGLRCLDIILGINDKVVYDIGDVIKGDCQISDAIVKCASNDRIHLISAPMDISKVIDVNEIAEFCLSLKKYYDYIIIDMPAGIGMGCSLSPKVCDITLIVVTPDPICIRDARKVVNIMRECNYNNMRLLINMATKLVIKKNVISNYDEIIDNVSVQLIGIIPDDINIKISAFKGFNFSETVNTMTIFSNIASRIEGNYIPLRFK